jgi:hypothetical protein
LPGTGSALRHPPEVLTPPLPPPPVRLDRIASSGGAGVQGQLVSRGKAVEANVEVLLVHADRPGLQQRVRADSAGNFDAALAPGAWLVYTREAGGQPVYRGKVLVREHQTSKVRVLLP